jgi:hypothetical protein
MEENVSESGPPAPPAVVVPVRARYSRGAETLIRVAICVVSGMIVSLGWILASRADMSTKAWSIVIGLSTLATMTVLVGHTRAEVNKARYDLAATEARLLTAIEAAVAEVRAERNAALASGFGHLESVPTQPPSPRPRPGRSARSQRVRRGLPRLEPTDPVISDELRIFLQGRESAYDDDYGNDGPRT